MSDHTVIRCNKIGKKYSTGASAHGLRSVFTKRFLQKSWQMTKPDFWALQDINFEMQKGDVLGFIGHNGAGKSTLLKILSKITKPSTGHAEIHGKVASLLEVGAGFHPELNAVENIKFNGAILGIRAKDVHARIDEILDFSGLTAFKEKPVKYYSTGMYIRLGFSVASILKPDVLLIDEVLSVGDLAFQKKSLSKIQSVIQDGATVIVCSHDLGTIKSICNKGLLMENGKMKSIGDVDTTLNDYMDSQISDLANTFNALQNEFIDIQKISINAGDSFSAWTRPILIQLDILKKQPMPGSRLVFRIQNHLGLNLLNFFTEQMEEALQSEAVTQLHVAIPGKLLAPGIYTISIQLLQSGSGQIIRQTTIGRFIIYSEADYPDMLLSDTLLAPNIEMHWH